METQKIGIVGNGRYGGFFKTLFEKQDYTVKISDVGTSPNNEDVVRWADVVLIAVTLTETVKVIESLIPLLREEQLVMDIASTMTGSVEAMLKSKAEVVGLHPFCAPSKRGTFNGQTIFVHRARVSKWTPWLKVFLLSTKAMIVEVEPYGHDRKRTVDQMLEHMCTLLKSSVMRRLELDAAELFEVASPVYKLTAVQMARMFTQSPELYAGIAMANPFVLKTLELFRQEFDLYCEIVRQRDLSAYITEFAANARHIGSANVLNAFLLSEHLIGFMADLSEEDSLLITLPSDESGMLEKVSGFFREAGINLVALHSRRVDGKVEFFICLDRHRMAPEVLAVTARLQEGLGAKVGELKAVVV